MSKVFKNFVGIDISKTWFDAAIISSNNFSEVHHQQFTQTPEGHRKFEQWLHQHDVLLNDETLVCMEYTGIYNTGLVNFLVKGNAQLWVEMPLRIKRASGLQRGGDDKSAATKIAWYALRYCDAAKLWKPCDTSIERLKHLITQRERMVTSIKHLTVPVEELKQCGCIEDAILVEQSQKSVIKQLHKAKEKIEALIAKIIQHDEQLCKKVKSAQSVHGIGMVTATALLVYTKGFTAFDSAKQMACYCGVVPFNKTSGSSVRYKPSVSPFANMKLKRLLHLCAMSAIQNDAELKLYYQRKILEGKNKMSVINAVRNKLVHRVFSVVRDERMFEDKYAAKCL
jgi:transposase